MDRYGNKFVKTIKTNPLCILIKLCRHVNNGERMNPIDFGGQRSRVMMGFIDKCTRMLQIALSGLRYYYSSFALQYYVSPLLNVFRLKQRVEEQRNGAVAGGWRSRGFMT